MTIKGAFKKISTLLILAATVLLLTTCIPVAMYLFTPSERPENSSKTADLRSDSHLSKYLVLAGPGGAVVMIIVFVLTILDKLDKEPAAAFMVVWAVFDIAGGICVMIGHCYMVRNTEDYTPSVWAEKKYKRFDPDDMVKFLVAGQFLVAGVLLIVTVVCVMRKKGSATLE